MVQDYPVISGVPIATADLVAAIRNVPSVVAVKSESSPSPPAVAELAAGLDVPIFGGLGGTCLLDELAVGAAGAMTGFSVPEGLLACVGAFREGGFEAAREVWRDYLPLVNFEFQAGIALGLRKRSLVLRGLISYDAVRRRPPYRRRACCGCWPSTSVEHAGRRHEWDLSRAGQLRRSGLLAVSCGARSCTRAAGRRSRWTGR